MRGSTRSGATPAAGRAQLNPRPRACEDAACRLPVPMSAHWQRLGPFRRRPALACAGILGTLVDTNTRSHSFPPPSASGDQDPAHRLPEFACGDCGPSLLAVNDDGQDSREARSQTVAEPATTIIPHPTARPIFLCRPERVRGIPMKREILPFKADIPSARLQEKEKPNLRPILTILSRSQIQRNNWSRPCYSRAGLLIDLTLSCRLGPSSQGGPAKANWP